MNVRIISRGNRDLVIEIEGEDHTLGNMLMKEALRHPNVEHAAYRIPHPLKSTLEFTIVVKEGGDLSKVLREIIAKLRGELEEFKRAVEDSMGRG